MELHVTYVAALLLILLVADVPAANYDESKVPKYTLPDPLVMASGEKVGDTKTWREKRRPEILELFRNSRVIGRRFPIVHLLFAGGKFIEVATFRALETESNGNGETAHGDSDSEEEEQRLLVEADRLLHEDDDRDAPAPPQRRRRRRPSPLEMAALQDYGTPAEDALRRDLTINGLFYDISTFSVLDYVGGLEDLDAGLVRIIGDPDERYREDPVRMIRAVRHAARLGFRVEEGSWEAIGRNRARLAECSKARLMEEFYRDLRGGASVDTFRLMLQAGLLQQLLPESEEIFPMDRPDALVWKRLAVLDGDIEDGERISNPVLLGLLFAYPLTEHLRRISEDGKRPDFGRAAYRYLKPLTTSLGVSRRDTEQLFLIAISQRRMLPYLDGEGSIPRFLRNKEYFPDALRLLRMEAAAREVDLGELRFSSSGRRRGRRRRRRHG